MSALQPSPVENWFLNGPPKAELPCLSCVGPSAEDEPLTIEVAARRFPALNRRVGEHRLVYLDNAATTQKPDVVIDTLAHYYREHNANVHRGVHTLSEESTAAYEHARREVAEFLGAPSARQLVFTRGATEAINLVAQGWARPRLQPGDEILLTEMEHHSNLVPWQMVARDTGARLRYVGLHPDGTLRLDEFQALLSNRTRLVAVTHLSNVLGTINPIGEITRAAHRVGAFVLVDGAQSVAHLPVNVQELGCDFFAFSGHKLFGPTGIGGLYGTEGALETLTPVQGGGDMILRVEWHGATWNEIPYRFEAGTPPIAQAIGLGVAVQFLNRLGMEKVAAYEAALTQETLARLDSVAGLTLYGRARDRGSVFAFSLAGLHPHDVAQFLDFQGLAVRAGHHCAQPLMSRLGVPATTRASLALYNTLADVEALVRGLEAARERFA